jgi:hypothetical protein
MGRPAIVTPATGLIAGVLVGVVGIAALAGAGWPERREEPTDAPAESAAAAIAFLATWRESRLGTWVVDAHFVRRTPTGRELTTTVHTAQRPPDRLVVGLGAVDARRGGRRLACAPAADEALVCRDGGPAPAHAAEVDAELRTLAGYVSPTGFYAVAEEPGRCFRLRLRAAMLSPPYGQLARFCFDQETWAPVRSEIERFEAIDRTVAFRVSARPTDADLDPEKVRDGGGRG